MNFFRICAPNAVDPAPALSIPLPEPVAAPTQPAITNETYLQQQHQQQTYHYPPKAEEPAPSTSIFPDSSGGKELDVTSIITKRLNAMRKLQDNPLDTEALKLMYNTQKDVCIEKHYQFHIHDNNYEFRFHSVDVVLGKFKICSWPIYR